MRTENIDDHTILPDLLTPGGTVLDVGCRGFGLPRILAGRGMMVIAMDPDPEIEDPGLKNVTFVRKALVGDPTLRVATYASWSYGDGNFVTPGEGVPPHASESKVACTHIAELMSVFNVKRFDLVKLDCEGSEYDMLLRWPGPVARQISVEFHDSLGMNPREPEREAYYVALLDHLGRWYDVVQHEKFYPEHLNAGHTNYWDSLFVLKG